MFQAAALPFLPHCTAVTACFLVILPFSLSFLFFFFFFLLFLSSFSSSPGQSN
jgi:hypothetical protein